MEDIKLENSLPSNTVRVGQALKIPTTATTSYYVVKKGDTLYSIASKFDTTVSKIMQLNNLKTPSLAIGQQLLIPVANLPSTDYAIYTVKPGNNLYSIAKKYNVSVDSIKSLNNLTSDILSIGQQLKIPITTKLPETENSQKYTVKPGDTLYSIAKNFGMSVEELISLNNLKSNTLSIGQQLIVNKNPASSNNALIPLGSTCYGTGYKEPTYITYTVKRGDSLYTIAKKYNTSIEHLKRLNDLNNNDLSIGQVLKIKEVN